MPTTQEYKTAINTLDAQIKTMKQKKQHTLTRLAQMESTPASQHIAVMTKRDEMVAILSELTGEIDRRSAILAAWKGELDALQLQGYINDMRTVMDVPVPMLSSSAVTI